MTRCIINTLMFLISVSFAYKPFPCLVVILFQIPYYILFFGPQKQWFQVLYAVSLNLKMKLFAHETGKVKTGRA